MSEKRIGIIMHGITGRMGMNQHLIRSILEIRKQGGVALKTARASCPTRSSSAQCGQGRGARASTGCTRLRPRRSSEW